MKLLSSKQGCPGEFWFLDTVAAQQGWTMDVSEMPIFD